MPELRPTFKLDAIQKTKVNKTGQVGDSVETVSTFANQVMKFQKSLNERSNLKNTQRRLMFCVRFMLMSGFMIVCVSFNQLGNNF